MTHVSSANDLAIRFNARLSYDDHFTKLASKSAGSLCQINTAKRILDRQTLLKARNALQLKNYVTVQLCGQTRSTKETQKITNRYLIRHSYNAAEKNSKAVTVHQQDA